MLVMHRFSLCISAAIGLLLFLVPAFAQKRQASAPYILREFVRESLIDVTVTDSQGNLVTNLSKSAFHIYDNGHPQIIESFVNHAGSSRAVLSSATASGLYSNRYLTHPPPVYNIALIDMTTMSLVEQMVLRKQLVQLLQQLPSNAPLAIYMRNGSHILLVQNFTSSHVKLLAAVRRTIPHFRTLGFEYDTDVGVLSQMANTLSQYPGRKNVIWFSGGSNFFLIPDDIQSPDMRTLYDRLEAERIAVYPIDVRGLLVRINPQILEQQLLMGAEAAATGGKAYYNTNAIAQSAFHILSNSSDFYTITYRPNDLHRQGKWHKVRIAVDGPYRLSYRRGYFDDSYVVRPHLRPLIATNGEKKAPPDVHSNPIIFQAKILPAASDLSNVARGTRHKRFRKFMPYVVHYWLPISAFNEVLLGANRAQLSIGLEVVIFNRHGDEVGHTGRLVKMTFSAATSRLNPHGQFAMEQLVRVPRGENEVYLAVWDASTGRLGTLQVPLCIKRH